MSSTIHSCTYDPAGGKDYQPINPLTSLQSGPLSISHLIHEIAEKDFGYTGTEKYTLTLQSKVVVLKIWDGPSPREFGTQALNNHAWHLTKDSKIADLKDPAQISNRINHTLFRIKQAYEDANLRNSMNSPIQGSAILDNTPTTHNTDKLSGSIEMQKQISTLEQEIILLKSGPIEDLKQKNQEQQQINENLRKSLEENELQLKASLENENLLETQIEYLLKLQIKHSLERQREADEKIHNLELGNHNLKKSLESTKNRIVQELL